MSKGDNRRPSSVPKEEFDKNFEAIFGEKKLNVWEDEDRENPDADQREQEEESKDSHFAGRSGGDNNGS